MADAASDRVRQTMALPSSLWHLAWLAATQGATMSASLLSEYA